MRTALFSHQSPGRADARAEPVARSSDSERPALEQQQALLLEVLRRAGGEPVSYSELNDAGVEFPASVVSELELAGVAVERCLGREPGPRRLLGVRLPPAAAPDPGPVAAGAASRPIARVPRRVGWAPVHLYRAGAARTLLEGALVGAPRLVGTGRRWARRAAPRRPAVGGRMLAPLALLAAVGVAVAVVVSAMPASGGQHVRAARAGDYATAIARLEVIAVRAERALATKAARTGMPSTSAGSTSTTSTATRSTTSRPTHSTQARPVHASPPPASPRSAAHLEARGHGLMVAGQYDRAVPVLQRALRATGEHPRACVVPTTQACLTYAFALYDLARSLRLAGRPAAAVPILKRRMQIDNQRPVVAAELAHARHQASRRAG